jgi:hypothetical protein
MKMRQEAQAVEFVETVGGVIESGVPDLDAALSPEEREAKRLADHFAFLIGEDGLPKFISVDYVQSKIQDSACFTAPETSLVICYIKMKSGATVTGEANFTDLESFDETKGHEQAYNDALRKLIALEIYALADRRAVLAASK